MPSDDPSISPSTPSPSAGPGTAPPVGARVAAFAAIVAAGAAGGFIGWSFVDLQCTGDCTVAAGLGALGAALVAAVGVGVVAVLALRAVGEWQAQRAAGATAPPARELIARRKDTPPTHRKPPRVR